MRKRLGALAGACVLSLALVACGGAADTTSTDAGTTGEEAAQEQASAEEKFLGNWKFAAVESQGITMAGDLSAILSATDTEFEMSLDIADDHTGTWSFNGETADFTWELLDDERIAAKVVAQDKAEDADAEAEDGEEEEIVIEVDDDELDAEGDEEGGSAAEDAAGAASELEEALGTDAGFELLFADDSLRLDSSTLTTGDDADDAAEPAEDADSDSGEEEEAEFEGVFVFTHDGTIADMPEISSEKATEFTSADEVSGTWTLSGINMMGLMFYGDAKDLSAMAGDTDTSITFDAEKVSLMGSEGTWSVGKDGAAIDLDGTSVPVHKLGDALIVDLSDIIGFDMVMMFTK
jgi:hypothetical protein